MHFGLGPDLHHEAADAPLAQSAALPFRQRGLRLFTQCGSDSFLQKATYSHIFRSLHGSYLFSCQGLQGIFHLIFSASNSNHQVGGLGGGGHSGPGYPLKIFLLHLCWSFEPHSFIFFLHKK